MKNDRITMIVRPIDAIKLLKVSRTTLWRWEQNGTMPPRVEIAPGIWVWRGEDLKRWVDNLSERRTSCN